MKWLIHFFLGVLLGPGLMGQVPIFDSPRFIPVDNFPYSVITIFKDSRGFMWFGTAEGLVQYDGIHNKVFYADKNDSTKLWDNQVLYIFEDSRGMLWLVAGIGLYAEKTIQVFDYRTEHFTKIDVSPVMIEVDDDTQLQAQNDILEDDEGNIWISCSVKGLYKINTKDAHYSVNHYRQDAGSQKYLPADSIGVLFEDSKNRLWVGTRDGLFHFDKDSEQFNPYPTKERISGDEVTGIVEDDEGFLWVNYNHHGLVSLDTETGKSTIKWAKSNRPRFFNRRFILMDSLDNLWMIHQDGGFSKPVGGLDRYKISTGETFEYFHYDNPKTHEYVNPYIELDSEGMLWMRSLTRLYFFDQKKDSFQLFANLNQVIAQSFHPHPHIDDQRNIWLPITGKGLLKYHPSNQKFNILSQKKVFGLIEDKNNNLWVSSEEGLFKYTFGHDNKVAKIEHILAFEYCNEPLEDSSGNIWVSCPDLGARSIDILYKIEAGTNKITSYKHDPDDPSSITVQPMALFELENGNFLIETYWWGLDYFNPETGKSKHFLHDENDPNSISDNIWAKVMIDDQGKVWVFNQKGIDLFDPEKESFTRIDTTSSERFGSINELIKDLDGAFWISGGNGLFKYDPETAEVLAHYSVVDGLPGNYSSKILEDNSGNLWIGSSTGLILFNKGAESFRVFNLSDGLPSNNIASDLLQPGPGIKRRNGDLLFGTSSGLISFHPDSLTSNSFTPKAVITDLKLFNQSVAIGNSILPQSISVSEQIVLSHDQNAISFEFASLSYANPSKDQYAYFMEGIDQDWNYVGNQTNAGYAGLQPGQYIFHLKASNNDGLWNETPTTLSITILPPWWETWWAYAIYAVLFFGSLYSFYRFQVNRKLELAETKRLKELDEFKTRFYTNITHEFRTPLTVILGISDQIDVQYQKVKNLIKRNALSVLQLVNQLLDLSKLESGMLHLNQQQSNIVKYIKYVAESFHSLAEIKHIDIHFRSEELEVMMDFDVDKIMNILSNLLSNAIKFTPDKGHISILLSKVGEGEEEKMNLRISDTGVGIAADQLENIFDRFYQVDSSMTRKGEGTGIGLALTRELVRLMGGTIIVKSTVGQGTEFTVELPITNEAELMEKVTPQEIVSLPTEEKEDIIQSSNEHSDRPVALIVEDSIDVVYYLKTCLQVDYSLRVANNGQEGIDKALESSPDIIISDVMMPEKNGYELCDTLKNDVKTSHIPIILLTAKATEEDKLEGLGVGADAYLTKPFNVDELKIRIKNLIRERKKLWQHYNESLSYQPQTLEVSSPDQKFLTQAMDILEAYKSDSEFNSANLQQELGVSRTLLHVKLKALTGQSTTEFIRTYRLKYAATLLLQDFGNIAEIAYESGFNDQSYFTKSFRKHFGVAPSEYKESR